MRPAPVGFQCPECVAGAQAKTAPLYARAQRRGALRAFSAAPVTIVLIAINVAVWLAGFLTGRGDSPVVNALALQASTLCLIGDSGYFGVTAAECAASGGLAFPGVSDGGAYQLLTSMFVHVDPIHIGLNMVALWFLGPMVERTLGRARYLALYLLSGLAGSVTVYWLSATNGQTVGASGAIFGLLGALLVIVLRRGGDARTVLMWLGINVVFTFTMPGISWQGHFGGLAGGALVAFILLRDRGPRTSPTTWLLLAGFAVVLAGLTVARTLQLS